MRQSFVSFSFQYPLYLFFLLSTSTLHTTTITALNDLIHRTCKQCAEKDPNLSYKFCVKSLEAAPKSRKAEDLVQLGMISIKLLHHNLTNTKSYIKELLNNQKLDTVVRSCLNDCYDLYSDAIFSIKQAKQDFKHLKYGEANVVVSSVMDASTTCEDGFKEKGGVVSPLSKRNYCTFQLSAISLSVINMLDRNSSSKY